MVGTEVVCDWEDEKCGRVFSLMQFGCAIQRSSFRGLRPTEESV